MASTSVLGLAWRPPGTDVAKPRRMWPAAARDPRVAGARLHGGGRRGHEKREEGAGSTALTTVAEGREAVTGDEDEGGGAVGVAVARAFGRRSGEGDVSTGCAVVWRSCWWRRRGHGVGDGGARGGGVDGGRR